MILKSRNRGWFCTRLVVIFVLLFLVQGCGIKYTPADEDDKYVQDEEEVVEEPYTPRDDGLPLSSAELRAFNSTGDLDRELSQEDRRIVELHFKFFVHERRRTFERYLARSARYLPYVKKVFKERGLPEDLVYLFMVESGGNPNAISPVGATGLWQFMPFTGKKFGLTQNAWIDERRDPFKATFAASDYLLKLYYDFNDWHLAAAAYNAGEGKIGRAVDGTGAADFFELCRLDCQLEERRRLKDETRQYVPRLLAVAKIMRNLKLLGFPEPSLEEAYDLAQITVPAGTNLRGLASTLGFTWDEFSGMNPAFKRTASPPTATATAYVPPHQVAAADTWLQSEEARLYAAWREYTVKKRDTLASVSKRHGVSVAALRQANSFRNLPRPGSVIMIPSGNRPIEAVATALPDKGAKHGRAGKYTVVAGDSLYSLAKTWGTDIESIRQLNRLGSEKLQQGQRLSIPSNSKHVPPAHRAAGQQKTGKSGQTSSGVKKSYTVRPGESWYGIASVHGISVEALAKANGVSSKSSLRIGQKITIPASSAAAKASPASSPKQGAAKERAVTQDTSRKQKSGQAAPQGTGKKKSVTVSKGDTLFSIAKKYGVSIDALKKANKLGSDGKIKNGQRLTIP